MKSDLTGHGTEKMGKEWKKMLAKSTRIKTYFMKMIKFIFVFMNLVVNSSRWKEFFIYSKCEILNAL